MAKIETSTGDTVTVDDADLPLVQGHRWWTLRVRGKSYAVTRFAGSRDVVLMHRFLLGAQKGQEVDHEDCDGLNNQRGNLRRASHAENTQNRKTPSHNKSGYKGVCWGKKEGKWVARITAFGRRVNLGVFTDVHEAGAAYAAASQKHHGQFGRVG